MKLVLLISAAKQSISFLSSNSKKKNRTIDFSRIICNSKKEKKNHQNHFDKKINILYLFAIYNNQVFQKIPPNMESQKPIVYQPYLTFMSDLFFPSIINDSSCDFS